MRSITRKVLWKLTGSHFETDLEFFKVARGMWPERYTELLAWAPGWFVHVDPCGEYPRFARTREPTGDMGLYLGPFPDGKSAERFIDAIGDAFDLCRNYRCLRQSPRGERCAYAQMDRCLSPCDGTISMEDYRCVVAQAADFATGQRKGLVDRLNEQMKSAAAELKFELAANLKVRLERLDELDRPCYEHVAPLEEFRYILVQGSGARRKAKVFLVNQGKVVSGGELDYPLRFDQLEGTLRQMGEYVRRCNQQGPAGAVRLREPDLWRMGLVAHYLFCSERRRGVILRWTEGLAPGQLGEVIEAVRGLLKLRGPKPRREKPPIEKKSN